MKRLLLKNWTLAVIALSVLGLVTILLSFTLGGVQAVARIGEVTSVLGAMGSVLIVSYETLPSFLRLMKSVLLENQPGRRFARFSVRGLTGLAAFLAGREGPTLLQ